MELLLHPQTRSSYTRALGGNGQAWLILGPLNSGKRTVGLSFISDLLGTDVDQLQNNPYFMHIVDVKDAIGIEEIRNIHTFLQLKTVGLSKTFNRAILIENIHFMTIPAQNALLKTLEEPPVGTAIVLTGIRSNNILTTIYSRTKHIDIFKPNHKDSAEYFDKVYDKDFDKTYNISGGSVGLMSDLLNQGSNHPLFEQLQLAKTLLTIPTYDKLLQRDTLAVDKEFFKSVVFVLVQISKSALLSASAKGNKKDISRWLRILKISSQTSSRLENSPNLKLLATDLLLNL